MRHYMIELSHEPAQCIAALDRWEEADERAQDLLDEVYWGCMSGRHAGWVVIDADSEQDARERVPESIRKDVMVTEVNITMPHKLEQGFDPENAHPGKEEPFWS